MTSINRHITKNMLLGGKACYKGSKPIQIKQYNFKNKQQLKIKINTPIRKQSNHYIFGDRVEKIVNEVHQFYGKRNSRSIPSNNSQHGPLLKVLQLNLGDTQLLRDDKTLMRDIFPVMSQLKEYERDKDIKYIQSISIQIKWFGSQKTQRVKYSYMYDYETELIRKYKQVRQMYSKRWSNHVKLKKRASMKALKPSKPYINGGRIVNMEDKELDQNGQRRQNLIQIDQQEDQIENINDYIDKQMDKSDRNQLQRIEQGIINRERNMSSEQQQIKNKRNQNYIENIKVVEQKGYKRQKSSGDNNQQETQSTRKVIKINNQQLRYKINNEQKMIKPINQQQQKSLGQQNKIINQQKQIIKLYQSNTFSREGKTFLNQQQQKKLFYDDLQDKQKDSIGNEQKNNLLNKNTYQLKNTLFMRQQRNNQSLRQTGLINEGFDKYRRQSLLSTKQKSININKQSNKNSSVITQKQPIKQNQWQIITSIKEQPNKIQSQKRDNMNSSLSRIQQNRSFYNVIKGSPTISSKSQQTRAISQTSYNLFNKNNQLNHKTINNSNSLLYNTKIFNINKIKDNKTQIFRNTAYSKIQNQIIQIDSD